MANTKIPAELSSTPSISDSGDATAITINSSEDVFVGSGTSNGISGGTAGLQVSGAGFKGTISASRHDNNQYGSSLMLGKSRNTTVGSNTIVQDDDIIGAVTFFADDGTNLDSRVANISAEVDGSPAENDTPGRLVFETTADGSAAPTERMRIDSSGNVGIGTNAPDDYDNNAAGISSNLVVKDSGHSGIIVISGTSSDAAISFGDGTGTDAYRGAVAYVNSQDQLYFKTAGTNKMVLSSAGNLGVGTTSPSTTLHLSGPTSTPTVLTIGSTNSNCDITLQSANSSGVARLRNGTNDFQIHPSGAEVISFGSNYILINGGNGQTYSDYVRTYSKAQSITFSSSTSSTSTTLSGYLTYQFMIDATLHFGYSGNGAISTHIRLSICNTYSGISTSTLHTAIGQSHNSYHTFTFSGTGAYNTRQLVVTCNPQGGQNASNTSGTIYYGMGV